jgi:hypothetical protein
MTSREIQKPKASATCSGETERNYRHDDDDDDDDDDMVTGISNATRIQLPLLNLPVYWRTLPNKDGCNSRWSTFTYLEQRKTKHDS